MIWADSSPAVHRHLRWLRFVRRDRAPKPEGLYRTGQRSFRTAEVAPLAHRAVRAVSTVGAEADRARPSAPLHIRTPPKSGPVPENLTPPLGCVDRAVPKNDPEKGVIRIPIKGSSLLCRH